VASLFRDWLALTFTATVLLILCAILIFTCYYISEDSSLRVFNSLIVLFALSIVILINRANLVALILGWDGLGIVSYFLVIFYSSYRSNSRAIVVVLSNRVGDGFIIVLTVILLKANRFTIVVARA
jgi:NADH-ubiquinone oxidoreductase chain 5